ncbi:MAG: ABC transporter ATP-binding protein, partial [Firmicutes bacterium]|nr:ABC transporter ATP-binding protein [Bacillota bacterium]
MRTVLGYYKKYIPAVIGIGLFLFGNAMCELALPGYMSDIINNGVIPGDMAYIREKGFIMILVAAGSSCASIAASLLSSRTAAGSARSIRGDLFKKVTAFSTAELQQFSTASLITRSTNDVQMVQQATTMLLRMAFFAPIMGFGAVIKALQTSVPLSWTVGVALIVVLAIMGISFVAIFPKFKVLQSKLDRVNLIMKERLAGILVVRAFNTEKKEQKRFD